MRRSSRGSDALHPPGDLIGTILYMQPERIRGSDAGACSDIFAFRVVFYELPTGENPFEGGSHAPNTRDMPFTTVAGDVAAGDATQSGSALRMTRSSKPDTIEPEVRMPRWRRAAVLGVLSWAVPFFLSFLLFPLKRVNQPLFSNIMAVIVLLTAGMLLRVYFRGRAVFRGEAVLTGMLWLAINLILDYPMFAHGPMRMTIGHYYSEIGFAYLLFPTFGLGAALVSGAHHVT